MKMRKVLSLVLALALVLGSFSMAFAGTYSDTAGAACDEAVNVLTELGVVNGYEDGTYKPNQVVTRAEAAKLIIAALGLSDYATGSTSSFTDLAGYSWAQGYIGYAQALGILKGYGDGTYKPGNTVTYNEMATIVVRALGYSDDSLTGTWPANYVAKAKTLGIMDSIVGGGGALGANRGDCAIMIYNALALAIGSVDADNKWSYESKLVDGVEKYADTMFLRLGVQATAEAAVITYADAQDAVTNITSHIGAFATTLENKDGNIVAIDDMKSIFLKGKMDGDKFKVGDVKYTIASTAFGSGAMEFVNADDTTTTTSIGVDTVTLAAKVSGTTIKNIYSVMTWTIDDADFFSNDDADDIDEDNSLFGFDFPTDDSDNIDTVMFTLNGVDSLSDIEKDDVVYVYVNDGVDKIVRVDVGTEVVEGDVTRVSSGGKYTINGTVYEAAADMAINTITPKAGDEVKAFLDYSGKVYKFEKLSGGADDYAVVIDATLWVAGGTFSDTKVKMMLADGSVSTFVVDRGDINLTESAFDNAVENGDMIKYALNSDGQISEILTVTEVAVTDTAISSTGYINSKRIATDAVIFTYDTSGALPAIDSYGTDTDMFGVTTRANVLDTDDVYARLVEKDGLWVAMLINNAASTDQDIYGVITDWASIGDSKYDVTMLVDGAETSYTATSTSGYDNFDELVMLTFNTAGNVTSFGEVPTAAAGIAGYIDDWAVTETPVTITNLVAKLGTDEISMTEDVVVYKWSVSDGNFVKGGTRDITNAEDANIVFYSTDKDTPFVADIVLVGPALAPM